MKKNLSSLSACAVAAAVCVAAASVSSCVRTPDDALAYSESGVTVSDDTRITFLSSTSRASINSLFSLEGDDAGFGVYAITPDDGFYISGGTYRCVESVWGWYLGDYSWPDSSSGYDMEFYAYYPKSDAAVAMSADADEKALTGTISIQDVASQTDLLSASSTVGARPTGGAISLTFDHILSQVNLSVVAGENSKVHVQSVTFKAMVAENDYDYTSKTWAALTATHDENVVYPYLAVNTDDGATVVSSDDSESGITSDNGSLMLLPQVLSAWDTTNSDSVTGARVVIVYRVTDLDGADVLGFSNGSYTLDGDTDNVLTGELFIKVGYPLSGEWVAGQSYSYVVELGGSASSGGYYISTKYFDEEGNETDLLIDEDDDLDVGDTVYDELINFTVCVTPWDGTNGTTTLGGSSSSALE